MNTNHVRIITKDSTVDLCDTPFVVSSQMFSLTGFSYLGITEYNGNHTLFYDSVHTPKVDKKSSTCTITLDMSSVNVQVMTDSSPVIKLYAVSELKKLKKHDFTMLSDSDDTFFYNPYGIHKNVAYYCNIENGELFYLIEQNGIYREKNKIYLYLRKRYELPIIGRLISKTHLYGVSVLDVEYITHDTQNGIITASVDALIKLLETC